MPKNTFEILKIQSAEKAIKGIAVREQLENSLKTELRLLKRPFKIVFN